MKFSDVYKVYEDKISQELTDRLVEIFLSEREAPYLTADGEPKEDEFLELVRFSNDVLICKRRTGVDWEVPVTLLREAVRLTLRCGGIVRQSDYKSMSGTSNFRGTPLHILISQLDTNVYAVHSIVNREIEHSIFGKVLLLGISYPGKTNAKENASIQLMDGRKKQILTQLWEVGDWKIEQTLTQS